MSAAEAIVPVAAAVVEAEPVDEPCGPQPSALDVATCVVANQELLVCSATATIEKAEPVDEPCDPQPSALDVASCVVANQELLVQSATATIETASVRLLGVPENALALRKQMQAVRRWAKAGEASLEEEHARKYTELLDALDAMELQHAEMVDNSSGVASVCDRVMGTMSLMLQKLSGLYDLKGIEGGSLRPPAGRAFLDAWNPQLIEGELAKVEQLAAELEERQGLLEKADMDSRVATMQRVERMLVEIDHGAEASRQLDVMREYKQKKMMLRQDRTQEEAAGQVMEAEIKFLAGQIEEQQTLVTQLTSHLHKLREDTRRLDSKSELSVQEAGEELQRLQKEAKEQQAQLMSNRAKAIEQASAAKKTLDGHYQKKRMELEQELLDVEGVLGNHIVFCLDRSGSMHGVRWETALQALKEFRMARVDQGCQDMVSVVAFNHGAQSVVTHEAMSSNFVETLRQKVSPTGGTCYSPAWDEVARCAQAGDPDRRLVVVFITDGAAWDLGSAAATAQRLHRQRMEAKSDMQTAVVNIDCAVADSVLEPMVKAGNGGCVRLEACGQQVPLLMNVATGSMVPHFRRLANLVNLKAASLRSRIDLVHERQHAEHSQQLLLIERMEDESRRRLKTLERSYKEVQEAGEENLKAVRRTFQQQKELLAAEIDGVTLSLEKATERLKGLELEKRTRETELEGHLKYLEGTRLAHEEAMGQLEKMSHNAAMGLKHQSAQLAAQQDQAGTTHVGTISSRREELEELKRLAMVSKLMAGGQSQQVIGLRDWLGLFISQIRAPLGEHAIKFVSKADFILPRMLEERLLQGQERMTVLLEYEARSLGAEGREVKEWVRPITSTSLSDEQLCSACGLGSEKDVEDAKSRVVKQVEEELFEGAGLGKRCKLRAEINRLQESHEAAEEACAQLQEALDKAGEGPAKDRLESKVSRKREEVEALAEKISEKEAVMRDRKQQLYDDHVFTFRLVRTTMEECRQAYAQTFARKEMEAVMKQLHGYHDCVHKPMRQLVQTVRELRQVYGIADASPRSEGARPGPTAVAAGA